MIYIYYLILIINIFALLIKKKSRLIALISTITLFFIFAGVPLISDRGIYRYWYDRIDQSRFEIGFVWINKLFKLSNISFESMTIILQIIITLTIAIIILKLNANYHLMICLYAFTIQLIGIIQLRDYYATIFIMIATVLLVYEKRLPAVIFCLLAASMHIASLFYLPFFVFYNNGEYAKNIIKLTLLILGITYAISFALNAATGINFIASASTIFSMFLRSDSEANYFIKSNTNFGSLRMIIAYLITLLGIRTSYPSTYEENEFGDYYYKTIKYLAYYGCFSIPLLLLNTEFYRIFRDICPSIFLFFSYIIDCKYKSTTNKYYQYVLVMLIVGIIWWINIYFDMNTIYVDVFKNNFLFE